MFLNFNFTYAAIPLGKVGLPGYQVLQTTLAVQHCKPPDGYLIPVSREIVEAPLWLAQDIGQPSLYSPVELWHNSCVQNMPPSKIYPEKMLTTIMAMQVRCPPREDTTIGGLEPLRFIPDISNPWLSFPGTETSVDSARIALQNNTFRATPIGSRYNVASRRGTKAVNLSQAFLVSEDYVEAFLTTVIVRPLVNAQILHRIKVFHNVGPEDLFSTVIPNGAMYNACLADFDTVETSRCLKIPVFCDLLSAVDLHDFLPLLTPWEVLCLPAPRRCISIPAILKLRKRLTNGMPYLQSPKA